MMLVVVGDGCGRLVVIGDAAVVGNGVVGVYVVSWCVVGVDVGDSVSMHSVVVVVVVIAVDIIVGVVVAGVTDGVGVGVGVGIAVGGDGVCGVGCIDSAGSKWLCWCCQC